MSRLQEAKDLLAAGCGLDYLQNLEYHGVLGTVPGCKGPNHGWAMPPGISIKDAVWGTINVEQAKWKPALTEFATLRELLAAMVAEVEALDELAVEFDGGEITELNQAWPTWQRAMARYRAAHPCSGAYCTDRNCAGDQEELS